MHVPFCHAKCAYCDFYSIARPSLADAYIRSIRGEYAARIHELGGDAVTTLYFGGGTPSLLTPAQFTELAGIFNRHKSIKEFTIECNPEDVDAPHLEAWTNAGVNRISIGVQSLIDAELKAVNRRHSAEDALKAIALIKNAGISNISADLIYGLPGQTAETWRYSVQKLISTGITHLSAYCLSYEEGTVLWRKREAGAVKEASEELIIELYNILCEEAAKAGFVHYEVSNFAKAGLESKHNSSYWRSVPYLGLGPGAHSLGADCKRRFNAPDIKSYCNSPEAVLHIEEENDEDRLNDLIMISLRTAKGLNKAEIPAKFSDGVMERAQQWLKSGRLIETEDALVIPEGNWLVSDAIIRDLFI